MYRKKITFTHLKEKAGFIARAVAWNEEKVIKVIKENGNKPWVWYKSNFRGLMF